MMVLLSGKVNEEGCSMAQRIAARSKMPVVLSYNLPPSSTTLKAFAERRVVQELRSMELLA